MLIEVELKLLQRMVELIRIEQKIETEQDTRRCYRLRNNLYRDIQSELRVNGDQEAVAYDLAEEALLRASAAPPRRSRGKADQPPAKGRRPQDPS